jgi:drug/metabolite transporter (DMT)-like permease
LVEPLTATLLGVLFFGDRLGPAGAVGAALLVSAVVWLTTRRSPGPSPPSAGIGTSR